MSVLYNKYRPRSFKEIVGQDHIVETLQNALQQQRVGHAYLLAGPRGTGKTSVARILAKELGISEIDLIEIDAASNRGIDDIRNLRDSVISLPTQSPKKMYVLDEAHMLTKEAFNALLKTLEEPPEHVHFILCTTESHKIPLTIWSRCQRLNFLSATEKVLAEYIRLVSTQEKIKFEDEAIDLLSELSEGSFRDALVLLEIFIGHPKKIHIKTDIVVRKLGLISKVDVDKMVRFIIQKDLKSSLELMKSIASKETNLDYFVKSLINGFRQLYLNSYLEKGNGINRDQVILYEIIENFLKAERNLKLTEAKLLVLEMAIINSIKMEASNSVVSKKEVAVSSDLKNVWGEILAQIKPHNHSVEALLKGCQPRSLQGGILELEFSYPFHKERIEATSNRELVEGVASLVLGQNVKIECTISKDSGADPVRLAKEVFGGEIIE